jgi:hypothetical protein
MNIIHPQRMQLQYETDSVNHRAALTCIDHQLLEIPYRLTVGNNCEMVSLHTHTHTHTHTLISVRDFPTKFKQIYSTN